MATWQGCNSRRVIERHWKLKEPTILDAPRERLGQAQFSEGLLDGHLPSGHGANEDQFRRPNGFPCL